MLALAASVVLSVHTVALVALVYGAGTYVGDDLVTFCRARTLPLGTFLMTPIDVHFIPVHRLVSYVVYWAAPLDYRAGLATLVVMHLVTVGLLYAFLAEIVGRTAAAVIGAVYGLHPCLGPLFLWWTSGLHRLGYVLCAAGALHAYLKFRRGSRWWLAVFAACAACSVGFYSKGVLVPLYVLGMEACLRFCRRSQTPVSRLLAAVSVGCVIAASYVVAWHAVTPPRMHALNLDVGYLARFVEVGVRVFVPSVVGVWLDSRLSVYVATYGAVMVLFAVSLWASRRTIVAWLTLGVTVVANLLLLGASAAKSGMFGIGSLLSDRYHFELLFLVIVFGGIAMAPALEALSAARFLRARFVRPVGAGAILVALVALSLRSGSSFEVIRATRYASSQRARSYMHHLRRDVAALHVAGVATIPLRDTRVSRDLVPMGNLCTTNASLLQLMDESVLVSNGAPFIVRTDGSIAHDAR